MKKKNFSLLFTNDVESEGRYTGELELTKKRRIPRSTLFFLL
jgi:hypothetical protein